MRKPAAVSRGSVLEVPPESRPGGVRLSELIAYHARSFGGAFYLYHAVIPNLKRSGRLIVDAPDYPEPVFYAKH